MQNGFGKTILHTRKQETDENKQPKRVTEQHHLHHLNGPKQKA